MRALVPPNATLDFEFELVGWEDYDNGVRDVEEENPFGDDDEDGEFTIDVDEAGVNDLVRAAAEAEAAGPTRGRATTADGRAYSWEESEEGVTLFVPLPRSLGSRDVSCTVSPRAIQLEVRADGFSLSGPLRGSVHSADAYWLIDDDVDGSRCVQVFMDKVDAFPLWNGVVIGERDAPGTAELLRGLSEGDDGAA